MRSRLKRSRRLLLYGFGVVLVISLIAFPVFTNPTHTISNKKTADIVQVSPSTGGQSVTSQSSDNNVAETSSPTAADVPSPSNSDASSVTVTTSTNTTGNSPSQTQCSTNVLVNGKTVPVSQGCNNSQVITNNTGNAAVDISTDSSQSSGASSNSNASSSNTTFFQSSNQDINSSSSASSTTGMP